MTPTVASSVAILRGLWNPEAMKLDFLYYDTVADVWNMQAMGELTYQAASTIVGRMAAKKRVGGCDLGWLGKLRDSCGVRDVGIGERIMFWTFGVNQ